MRGHCSPEQRAVCPILLEGCFTDTHHLSFGPEDIALRAISKVYCKWRELPINKTNGPRCWHKAIHASGYQPEIPSREQQLAEIWGADTGRAESELNKQLFLGNLMLERDSQLPPEDDIA